MHGAGDPAHLVPDGKVVRPHRVEERHDIGSEDVSLHGAGFTACIAASRAGINAAEKGVVAISPSSVVGRLRISREINEDQYQAAMKACRVKNDKDRALGLTQANAAKFMGASDNYEDWYRIRLQAWDDLKRAVREANAQESNRGANLFAALDHIVFQDREMLHMLGDLRLCLNALNRHFRG